MKTITTLSRTQMPAQVVRVRQSRKLAIHAGTLTYALQLDRLVGEPAVHYTENGVAVLILVDQVNARGITDQVEILRVQMAELYLLSKSNIESGMLVELSTPAR